MAARTRSNTGSRPTSSCDRLARQPEVDVLARDLVLLDLVEPRGGELPDDRLDELLGRRCPRGEANRRMAVDQPRLERALAVDQRGVSPVQPCDLDEALRVRARLRADDEDQCRAAPDHR